MQGTNQVSIIFYKIDAKINHIVIKLDAGYKSILFYTYIFTGSVGIGRVHCSVPRSVRLQGSKPGVGLVPRSVNVDGSFRVSPRLFVIVILVNPPVCLRYTSNNVQNWGLFCDGTLKDERYLGHDCIPWVAVFDSYMEPSRGC